MSGPSRGDPHRQRYYYLRHRLSLAQMQRVKNWLVIHRSQHPIESQVWEAVLTLWLMALIGWLPAYAFSAPWVYPLSILGAFAPQLYVQLRACADHAGHLRCDWLDLVG